MENIKRNTQEQAGQLTWMWERWQHLYRMRERWPHYHIAYTNTYIHLHNTYIMHIYIFINKHEEKTNLKIFTSIELLNTEVKRTYETKYTSWLTTSSCDCLFSRLLKLFLWNNLPLCLTTKCPLNMQYPSPLKPILT